MMKRTLITTFLALMMVLGLAGVALAADAEVQAAGLKVFAAIVTAAGFGIAAAAIGTGIAQGIAIRGAVEGTARNPEASGKITVTMIIGLAMIESLCIYTLVIALILITLTQWPPPLPRCLGFRSNNAFAHRSGRPVRIGARRTAAETDCPSFFFQRLGAGNPKRRKNP